ncbi:putative neuraminidase [Tamaricihabitans halophyticus]|uniref:Putative neuraminidase n=1 Tax=Tamaricihabitans halophyticus TaxID=1262583 RepID=A0A4R2QFA2_9PSEU|nr:exo-alpha-sialidase [Tamaricihabitans halophyticus]TCP47359.1 putative neuraminidase [Tamaricihabitans halophyticus]
MNGIAADGVLRAAPGDPQRQEAFLAAPTDQAHAANLMSLPGGDLGCVWFGGTQEGLSDINVWFARLGSAGAWSKPVALSADPARSEQNPILFRTPAGELWLLYTAQHAGNQDTAQVRLRVSIDNGYSWDAPRTLVPAADTGGVFVRQPPVVLGTGRWVLPVFRCVRPSSGSWRGDHDTSAVLVSDDRGSTWQHHEVPSSTGCVHMNILALADSTLLALFRRRQADSIHASWSADGVRWSEPRPTELPNNNSSIQATVLRDGRLALVYNASSARDATARRTSLYDEISDEGLVDRSEAVEQPPGTAFWGAPRAPITLALSADHGQSWYPRRNLETGDGYCLTNNSRDGLNRELSYPSITQGADGALHIAYTYFRRAIKYVRVLPDWAGW